MKQREAAFEDSEFYLLLETGTEDNVLKALDMISEGKMDVTLTSCAEETRGSTYLHYVVGR